MEMKGENMKFPKRLLAWMLSVVMVFGLAGTLAFANETETSSQYNHGTIAVKADDSNGTITMVKGGSAEITVSPYIHVQYQGCQMPDCPEMCGGEACFTPGKGCVCDSTLTERTANVTVNSSDDSVVKAGAVAAAGETENKVGSKADGKVTLTAEATGEAKITVTASLCDWVSTNKTYTVKVKDVVEVADFDAYTDHDGVPIPELAMGESQTDTQTAYVTLRFPEAMKIVDKEALTAEMMNTVKLASQKLGGRMGSIKNVELAEGGKALRFELSGWVAPFNGKITSEGVWENLTTEDSSKLAKSDMALTLPTGVETKIVDQVIADENTPASVTTRIITPKSTTRGMVHLILLKNGQPAAALNNHGAHVVAHYHNYMALNAEKFSSMVPGWWNMGDLKDDYTLTVDGDVLTITAKDSQPGDVLEFHVSSYLNSGSKDIDSTELKAVIEKAKKADKSKYTEENYRKLQEMVTLGEIVAKDTTYYAQTDVDDMTARINEAGKNVIVKTDDSKTDGKTDQGAAAGKNDKTAATGDMTPLAAILALLAVSGTAAGVAVKRRKAA
ncbi:MAG: hypothetical protein MRZ27_00325 [Eubacteriaceae bacterium]|nr:hypothetical protein [Eubacteriaceae bacterium]